MLGILFIKRKLLLVSGALGLSLIAGTSFAVDIVRFSVGAAAQSTAPILAVAIEHINQDAFNLPIKQGAYTRADYMRSLDDYYRFSKEGRRADLLMLYSPELRKMIEARYVDDSAVKNEAGQLLEAKVSKALYWGDLRFVLVEHKINDSKGSAYEWLHVFDCSSSRCLFVNNEEASQLASLIFYLQKTEGKSLSGDNKTNRHALSLHPSAARSNVQAAYPINVELKRANEVDRSAISKLYIQMTESIADGKDAGDSAKKYFDKGIPKSYSIASARSDIVADYTGTAFLLWVKQQPKWRVAAVYMQGVNSYLVIAKSANGEVLSLMASKLPDGWKFLSGPEDNPMWPLIQTHSFLKSINNL